MIGLMKKMQSDDLLQLALLLSLLRVDRNIYSHVDVEVPAATLPARVGIMDEWDAPTYFRHFRHGELHPKSLDSMLLDYEQRVFDDLNSLGRYNLPRHRNVTAYLLNVGTAPDVLAEPGTAPDVLAQPELEPRTEESPLPPMPESPDSSLLNGSLDSLFQDGPLSPPIPDIESEVDFAECDESFKSESFCDEKDELCWSKAGSTASVDSGYNWLLDSDFGENSDYELVSKKERLKAVESEEREEEEKPRKEVKKEHLLEEEVEIKEEPEEEQEGESEAEAYPLLAGTPDAEEPLAFSNEFALEETLQLVSLDDVSPSANPVAQESFKKDVSDEAKGKACSVTRKEKDFFEECHEELELFFDMIQTPQFHHNPRPFSGRMSYMRPMNMEQQQRWQDLANFLSLPESPYQHHAAAAAAAYHPAHPAHPAHPGHHPAHPPHGGHPGHPHGHPANGSYHHHHHHHHNMTSALPQPDRSVLLHNATLAPPVGDLNSSCPYPTIGANSNFGSAVATSMNLTNSSEPIGNENSGASFKMEPSSHDMMYYQNSSSEINQTDGFLSSILNDEDLQLMDMAMNEEMYSMRMLEGAVGGNNSMMGCHTTGERAGTDSDSAVSSMGSERVPSLSSDNEWMETNSDSGHNIADHYNSDYRKYRCYDYQYSTRSHTASENSTSSRLPVAPQKKYHMYGKRYLQEQASGAGPDLSAATPEEAAIAPLKYEPSTSTAMPVPSMLPAHDMKAQQESKYSCSIEFACNNLLNSRIGDHVNHNHTYHLPPENIGSMQRPYLKDKQKCRRNDEHQQQMTRDEKRARALNIPISVMDIINLPMDEFNERLSKYDLSESQLSLIRDIRRRGKNKVAAQNCRKRKLDQIICLADEVQQMRDRKNRAEKERHYLITERHRIKELFNQLYRHIFQNLRDPDGNPYSSYEYSLQMAADGSIVLMPRDNGTISPLVDPSEYSHLRGRHKDPPHKQ